LNKINQSIIEKYKKHRFSLGKANNTVKTDINAITKFAKHIKNKSFKNANEDDSKTFFIEIKNFIMRDHYASRIICFYKWLLKLNDDERPPIMEWYRYSKTNERERQKDPYLKATLIEPEEYKKIIQHVKMDMRMSSLYETLYLSGARPNEICNMKIEDVINDKGKISIIVRDSKSLPREIPLTEKPSLLLRWLENHPNKENKKGWLFISLDRRFKNRNILASSVSDKFKKLVKYLKLKNTLILYSFRKTRATIMFNQDYDDKEMGLLFGWKPHTVIDRRNEYDLRGLEDLKDKIFRKAEKYKTREELEEENKDFIENYNVEIEKLNEKYQKEINELNQNMENLWEAILIAISKDSQIRFEYDRDEKIKNFRISRNLTDKEKKTKQIDLTEKTKLFRQLISELKEEEKGKYKKIRSEKL